MNDDLPIQSAPVERPATPTGGTGPAGPHVAASQTGCEGLTGLAQQMCYSVLYGA
jgi:hypothetical protein